MSMAIPDVNKKQCSTNIDKKITSFTGLASWAKMTSAGGKLTAQACHPTK